MTEECGFYQTTHLTGWECPRCHIINSPYKLTCSCLPKLENASAAEITTTGTADALEYVNPLAIKYRFYPTLTEVDRPGNYIVKKDK